MASGAPTFDDDYQSVAERIRIFREKYPEGSLVAHDPAMPFTIVTVNDLAYVVVAAAAKRTPDDEAPGMGLAWCPIPGTDEYTRNSEIMNAQTSAWGRAIVAVLAADAKKIATSDEVKSAASHRGSPAPVSTVTTTSLPVPGAATANGTSVKPEVAPTSTDPSQESYNASAVTEAVRVMNDPKTTPEELRYIWTMLTENRLSTRRVAPPAGMEPDGDGLVPIGKAVSHVGRVRKEEAEAAAAAPTLPEAVEETENKPAPRRARKATASE